MDDEVGELFVYGTLMPGRLRWPLIADRVVDHVPDAVAGRLHDTGRGFPAADLRGDGRILGVRLRLRPDDLGETLGLVDEIEGPFLYERRPVTTEAGVRAWSYHAHFDVADLPVLTSWPADAREA